MDCWGCDLSREALTLTPPAQLDSLTSWRRVFFKREPFVMFQVLRDHVDNFKFKFRPNLWLVGWRRGRNWRRFSAVSCCLGYLLSGRAWELFNILQQIRWNSSHVAVTIRHALEYITRHAAARIQHIIALHTNRLKTITPLSSRLTLQFSPPCWHLSVGSHWLHLKQ